MKKQSIWVFQWRKSVHYWWSYILFSPECKELTSMLDPLLYRWGVPPVVIRCVHWTMQMWVLQTWIKALGLYIVMSSKRWHTSPLCGQFLSTVPQYGTHIPCQRHQFHRAYTTTCSALCETRLSHNQQCYGHVKRSGLERSRPSQTWLGAGAIT